MCFHEKNKGKSTSGLNCFVGNCKFGKRFFKQQILNMDCCGNYFMHVYFILNTDRHVAENFDLKLSRTSETSQSHFFLFFLLDSIR